MINAFCFYYNSSQCQILKFCESYSKTLRCLVIAILTECGIFQELKMSVEAIWIIPTVQIIYLSNTLQDGVMEDRESRLYLYICVLLVTIMEPPQGTWCCCSCDSKSLLFFVINSFLFIFFSHVTQHNIQNTTKQNNRHTLNISRSNQKGGREGRTIKTQKSLLYIITYIHQKTLPSINGRRPGPTNSRRCTFTRHYLQEACFSTHVWCKPVLDYCLLHSFKTSKQHSLLHWTNTETRIIIKKTQTWVNRPINSQ